MVELLELPDQCYAAADIMIIGSDSCIFSTGIQKLSETSPSVYTGAISENWLINQNPNGGYLMAILAKAMCDKSDKKSTPIVTANYISRCRQRRIEVRVEQISVSKQFSRYEARLLQDGAEKIRAFGTFAAENLECTINRNESSAPELAERDFCFRMPPIPGYTVFDNIDLLLDPPCAGWLQGKLIETSENRGWFRFGKQGNTISFPFCRSLFDAPGGVCRPGGDGLGADN